MIKGEAKLEIWKIEFGWLIIVVYTLIISENNVWCSKDDICKNNLENYKK